MVIGFKLLSITPENYKQAYDYVKSVTFLLEEDLLDILDKWKLVTIYSDRMVFSEAPIPLADTNSVIMAGGFVIQVYDEGRYREAAPPPEVPIGLVEIPQGNILINNVESRLNLSYVDEAGKANSINLGITEAVRISDFARYQFREIEQRKIIRYFGEEYGKGPDYTSQDFYYYDYNTDNGQD